MLTAAKFIKSRRKPRHACGQPGCFTCHPAPEPSKWRGRQMDSPVPLALAIVGVFASTAATVASCGIHAGTGTNPAPARPPGQAEWAVRDCAKVPGIDSPGEATRAAIRLREAGNPAQIKSAADTLYDAAVKAQHGDRAGLPIAIQGLADACTRYGK